MRRILSSTFVLLLLALIAVAVSIYADLGSPSWGWFQRSGAILVLIGAILSYRSIVRLGVGGVGGASVVFAKATVVSVNDSESRQRVKIKYDAETIDKFTQQALDKIAGYVGAWLMVAGTLIWVW